uniref:Uncharacterized protein n=1 Tax=Rhizophora mucronata TaxID=61149 RepID=A0A2P2QAW2_RHIMU
MVPKPIKYLNISFYGRAKNNIIDLEQRVNKTNSI